MVWQVGVVQVGQAFPFWVRHQTVLRMKVSTALPASLVGLVPGSEVAVAPRPRRTLAQQNALQSGDVQATAAAALEEQADHTDVCLRLQVKLSSLSMSETGLVSVNLVLLRIHYCWDICQLLVVAAHVPGLHV